MRATKYNLRWLFLGLSCWLASLARADMGASPVGDWIKVDATTKKPQEIIRLWEASDHSLSGKVIKVYDPAQNHTQCQDCPEDFKNQPIEGMQILWGLKQASDYTWNGGNILVATLGKVFPCNLTMSRDTQTLTVRIYSHEGELGRTQNWYRSR